MQGEVLPNPQGTMTAIMTFSQSGITDVMAPNQSNGVIANLIAFYGSKVESIIRHCQSNIIMGSTRLIIC